MSLALLTAVSIWLSAGVVLGGDSGRIAALPSFQVLAVLAVAMLAAAWLAKLALEQAWPLAISLILWLPYLGGSLIWDGPIEGIVWLVVVVGLIAARPPTAPAAFTRQDIAPWMAALIVALASAVVFGQVRNVIPGGDEPHYLAATQSVLQDGDLKVANNYEQGDYLDYFPGRLEPHFLKRSTSGDIYSIHAPGVSMIVLPAFAVGGYSGAVWTMILVAALSTALMWRLAFAVSGSAAAAWASTAAVALSAPYFFHTFTIYPEIIGGLCVLFGTWLLVAFAAGSEPGPRTLIGVGAALAVLPWLHTRFAVLAGILGLLLIARLVPRPSAVQRITALLAVPVVLGLAWFGFFYVVWGSPNPAVAYGADTSTSFAYLPRGVIGLLFDQQFGVLTTAPVYLVALAGAVMLLKAQPRLAVELALIAIPYALTVASYAMWWGGAAAPGRFLVAILPLAVVPLAVAWQGSKTLRTVMLILAVVSAALVVPRAFEDNGRFIFNNRSGVDATLQWLSANYSLAAAVPTVHGRGGTAALREGLIWLGVVMIAVVAAAAIVKQRVAGVAFTVTSLLLALSVSIATWLIAGDRMRADRQLATVERMRSSWHSTTIDGVPAGTGVSRDHLLQQLGARVIGPSAVLNRVPAGEYAIEGPAGTATGSMRIALGRNDQPIAQLSLDDVRNSQTPYRFHLPVMARNLRIEIDAPEQGEYVLRPVRLQSSAVRQPATRAARMGAVRAFFFDDWAYPERDGFWTRADGEATVVIDTDDPVRMTGLPVSVSAGPVPTTVRLSSGDWVETLALDAGQKRDVTLPPAAEGSWTVRIQSGPGFRPSERESGSRDVRNLAAWIAVP